MDLQYNRFDMYTVVHVSLYYMLRIYHMNQDMGLDIFR